MRQFFKNEFKVLEVKTGLKQYDKIMEKDDHVAVMDALLDEMCAVCKQFPFIPENDQQQIIKHKIITDLEFQGFNARIVYKWLAESKNIYFKEQAHIDSKAPEGYKIAEGEERSKWLNQWLQSLGNGLNQVPDMSPDEIKREGKIDTLERKGTKHPSTSAEQLLEKDLHIEYVRANYDYYTGKPLPTWIPEMEWREKQNEKQQNTPL